MLVFLSIYDCEYTIKLLNKNYDCNHCMGCKNDRLWKLLYIQLNNNSYAINCINIYLIKLVFKRYRNMHFIVLKVLLKLVLAYNVKERR